MLFTNSDERRRILDQLQCNPSLVVYGSAMEHARTTNLGIWGDVNALRTDCAAIMAAEVNRHRCSRDVTADRVLATTAFQAGFCRARQKPDRSLNQILASINPDLVPVGNEVKSDGWLADRPLHEIISEELDGQIWRGFVRPNSHLDHDHEDDFSS